MRTARSSKRPAGLRAAPLLVVLAALWAAPSGWADTAPTLEAPDDGATVVLPTTFLVILPAEGWARVQISTGDTFDAGSLACDSGWYHSGFHSTSSWTLPGVIGYSEVECDLGPGAYRWRAAYGGPTGTMPSEPDAAWSAIAGFAVQGEPAPPPAPPPPPPEEPGEPDYDEQEEALCGEDGDEDPDGGDPGEVEFSSDDVEPTAEELEIGTPPPAEPETIGSLAGLAGEGDATAEDSAEVELDTSGATACMKREILRWVAVSEFHVALGMDGTFSYEDGRETRTQVALQVSGRGWSAGGWVTEAAIRGARWNWPRRGPFHRRIAAEYVFRKHARCTKGGCYIWWAPHQWTGRLRPGAIRIQTTGWNNRFKFRLPHGHSWTKWLGTNKTVEKAVSISGVSLRAQAGYSSITKMTWKSTPRCRDNWIDPIDDYASQARLIYTWSDRC